MSAEPTTFDFACNWLVSSACFVRDAMLADDVNLDAAREQARARIHREEVLQEPDEEAEGEEEPDLPPPVDPRPLAIVITGDDRRQLVGTGTWSGSGRLLIGLEVLVPEEHRVNHADDSPATKAAKFKSRRDWVWGLCRQIRQELMTTSGQGDEQGNPYLNARTIDIYVTPADPEPGEPDDFARGELEVTWN